MKSLYICFVLINIVMYGAGLNAESFEIKVKPALLDSESGDATIGLSYEVSGVLFPSSSVKYQSENERQMPDSCHDGRISPECVTNDGINSDEFYIKYAANGLWAVDEQKNPLPLAKSNIDIGYGYFRERYSFDLFAQGSLEGNQDYSNKQNTLGGAISGYYSFSSDQSTYMAIVGHLDQVDAEDDKKRMAITNVNEFDRISGELHIQLGADKIGVKDYNVVAFEFNYRYYGEIDPPVSIENAGIDTHKLATYKLRFNKGYYIAYSSGSLPFDKLDERVVEVGFSSNIFE